MTPSLGDQQANDDGNRRAGHAFHEGQQRPADKVLGGQLRGLDVVEQGIDAPHDDIPDHGLEQVLLGLVVQVSQALADAGAFCNFLDARRGIPFLGEDFEGSLGNFLRTVFLASLVFWLVRHSTTLY